MRILFLCNRDLASNFALNLLLPSLTGHQLRVSLTERVGRIGTAECSERRELLAAEQSTPNEILFPLIERARFPDAHGRFLTFGEIARLRKIPVTTLANPNSEAGLEEVRAFGPDLILSVRYGAILKSELLSIPALGVLNLHSGLLPAYRGVLATFRALMNGDQEIGCTLHRISDGTIDTGAVIATGRVSVSPERSLLGHVLCLYPVGVELIVHALKQLERRLPLEAVRQFAGEGQYFSYPGAAEWAEFTRRGMRVTDSAELLGVYQRYLGTDSAGPQAAEPPAATGARALPGGRL